MQESATDPNRSWPACRGYSRAICRPSTRRESGCFCVGYHSTFDVDSSHRRPLQKSGRQLPSDDKRFALRWATTPGSQLSLPETSVACRRPEVVIEAGEPPFLKPHLRAVVRGPDATQGPPLILRARGKIDGITGADLVQPGAKRPGLHFHHI